MQHSLRALWKHEFSVSQDGSIDAAIKYQGRQLSQTHTDRDNMCLMLVKDELLMYTDLGHGVNWLRERTDNKCKIALNWLVIGETIIVKFRTKYVNNPLSFWLHVN